MTIAIHFILLFNNVGFEITTFSMFVGLIANIKKKHYKHPRYAYAVIAKSFLSLS